MTTPTITTVDPATGRPVGAYDTYDDARIDAVVARSAEQARRWAARPVAERAVVLRRIADLLREGREDYAALMTREMGKPLAESLGEVDKCALTADYYADHAEAFLAEEPVDVAPARAWVAHEPLGVVLAVMPWNFPFWQVMRAGLPALAAGNGMVLKHAANSTGSALALEELLGRAGAPQGLLGALVVEEPRVPGVIASLVADDRVQAVTLTGSNRAGSAVGALAGREVKKSVLELGGSDPFVVLADADLDLAVPAAVRARFTNAGQSCVCAKRFIVERTAYEEFVRRFVAAAESLRVGDPTDPATQMGPLAREDLRHALHDQVERSVAAGAELRTGGGPLDRDGYFYAPTVLTNTGPGVPAFDEETFGPVAAVAVAEDEDHAVELANATVYGLGASVWTADAERGAAVARRLRSGAVFVNAVVASDPRVPFGGVGRSGHGRELGLAGIREFTNTRTYWSAA
ncbi:NAD-dependent succinate-semialdehyde dehydrogenase [Nocardiopsis sp. NPDC006198]|uniref:NAD-dependent succinate-semialdehyde dehydrogenase n=1 Tax=Nocardiopsis sp. NPDC006198 TaxID=3154472 RepID=UPI0033A2DA65